MNVVLAEIDEWTRRKTRNHTQAACHCANDQQKDAELIHKAGHFLPGLLWALPDFISALFTTTAANGNTLIALLMCLDWKNNFFDNKFSGFPLQNFFLSHSSSRQHILSVHNYTSEDKEDGLLAENEN